MSCSGCTGLITSGGDWHNNRVNGLVSYASGAILDGSCVQTSGCCDGQSCVANLNVLLDWSTVSGPASGTLYRKLYTTCPCISQFSELILTEADAASGTGSVITDEYFIQQAIDCGCGFRYEWEYFPLHNLANVQRGWVDMCCTKCK